MPFRLDDRIPRRTFLRRAGMRTAALVAAAWTGSQLGWLRPAPGRSVEAGETALVGVVSDLLTGLPVPGAAVTATPADGSASTSVVADALGWYRFTSIAPGLYQVSAVAPGYLSMARDGHTVAEGSATRVDLALLVADPTPAQQELLYAMLVRHPEWPPSDSALPLFSSEDAPSAAVFVPDWIWVRLPSGVVTQMALDEYLRHVVPAEMPASWPAQALRAQAVAARTYAVAYNATQSRPICTTSSCQVYIDQTYATTDAAVSATHNVVATYNGSVITAFYFARCNGVTTRNSEQVLLNTGYGSTCTVGSWNYVAYCRARPCSGHGAYNNSCGYYGHGVGMCQTGARDFANQGQSYVQILQNYYTGVQINGGPPTPVAPLTGFTTLSIAPVSFRWTGTSTQYLVAITSTAGGSWSSGWLSATSYSVTLPPGSFTWHVTGRTSGLSDAQSLSSTFTLLAANYSRTLSVLKTVP